MQLTQDSCIHAIEPHRTVMSTLQAAMKVQRWPTKLLRPVRHRPLRQPPVKQPPVKHRASVKHCPVKHRASVKQRPVKHRPVKHCPVKHCSVKHRPLKHQRVLRLRVLLLATPHHRIFMCLLMVPSRVIHHENLFIAYCYF